MTLIAAIVAGCGNSKNAVAYSVAQNYFVNNTFENKEVETLNLTVFLEWQQRWVASLPLLILKLKVCWLS